MDGGVRGARPVAVLAAAVLWALLWALLWVLPAAAGPAAYGKGDPVTISGRVTGPEGRPIGQVTVLLEVSRNRFDWRRFRRATGDTLQIPVLSEADGQYRHDWRWDGYYDTFQLAVALPVPTAVGDAFEVLHRVEITQPVMQGSPVVVPIVVEDVRYLGWLRRFSDGSASAEEKRVYRELGRPDRLDFAGADAAAWWYFAAGKVYRFAAGELEEVETFDPVAPL